MPRFQMANLLQVYMNLICLLSWRASSPQPPLQPQSHSATASPLAACCLLLAALLLEPTQAVGPRTRPQLCLQVACNMPISVAAEPQPGAVRRLAKPKNNRLLLEPNAELAGYRASRGKGNIPRHSHRSKASVAWG